MNNLSATWTGKKSLTLHASDIDSSFTSVEGDSVAVLELNEERYIIMLEEDLFSKYGAYIVS